MFAAWGRLVHRHRWWVLAFSILILVLTLEVVSQGGTLAEHQNVSTEASRGDDLMRQLPSGRTSTGFVLIFTSHRLTVDQPAFRHAMQGALAPLAADRRVHEITTPFSSAAAARTLISSNRHSAIAEITILDSSDNAKRYYQDLRSEVHSSALQIVATGDLAVEHDFDTDLNNGLSRSGKVALPLSLVLLLLAFGSVAAALLPLWVGVQSILGGNAAALLINNHFTGVDSAAPELGSLLGLGLAIDYSLFITMRFKEELARGRGVAEALAAAMETAGRAVVFSGLTVMAALSGLFFYQGTWLGSVALPLVLLVALAVLLAVSLLASLLAILGRRVNALRIPLPGWVGGGFWHGLATRVMRHPWLVLLPTLTLVVIAASPFAGISLATDHRNGLPPSDESRRGGDIILHSFPRLNQASIPVVVQYPGGNPLSRARVGTLYDLSRRIAHLPGVVGVQSPVDLSPGLRRTDYVALYARPRNKLPASVRRALGPSVGKTIVLLNVLTGQPEFSAGARNLVRRIRAVQPAGDGTLLVAGDTAYDMDRTAWIRDRTPWALSFIVGITFLILLVLLGSVVLPIKALITNLLSISVSFGVMVWVFQDGHLSSLLNFTPGAIDPTVPVIMFCLMFGLSMDYEVFLLSRIQEEYRRTGDNASAVARGLERCGRLVTFAAAIMVAVFASFVLADVIVIKSAGLCLAVAVGVDATLMRGLIVPSAMVLMRRANWWLPGWLARVIHRLPVSEMASEPQPVFEGS